MINPRVSVALPVRNGRRYIAEAVDSVLGQTLSNLELIIFDNASTDGTDDICRRYAERDSRVRYYRSEVNRGAAWNYNRVAQLARAEYFKWMAHDDVISPRFLERCAAVLDEDPIAVACCARTIDIDEGGCFTRARNFNLNCSDGKPHRRFHDLICINHSCFLVFAVVRLSVLRQTAMVGPYVSSDRVLLAELALHGRLREADGCLLMHREHPLRSTRAIPVLQERIAWFDPAKAGRLTFPNWRLLKEYAACIRRAGLPAPEQILCYGQLLPWLRQNGRALRNDLSHAARRWLRRRRRGPCEPGRRPACNAQPGLKPDAHGGTLDGQPAKT